MYLHSNKQLYTMLKHKHTRAMLGSMASHVSADNNTAVNAEQKTQGL